MGGSKKGSHVGMVLSFVIFITFVVFLYAVLEPSLKIGEDRSNELELIKTKIIDMSSESLITLTITNSSPKESNCLKINVSTLVDDGNFIAKNAGENKVNSEIIGDFLFIDWADSNIFKVYISPEVDEGSGDTFSDCALGSIELVNSRREVFEEKIKDIFNRDYEELKSSIGLGEDIEFSLMFNDSVKEFSAFEKETSKEVYAEDNVIRYFDNEANINAGFIRIKVW